MTPTVLPALKRGDTWQRLEVVSFETPEGGSYDWLVTGSFNLLVTYNP